MVRQSNCDDFGGTKDDLASLHEALSSEVITAKDDRRKKATQSQSLAQQRVNSSQVNTPLRSWYKRCRSWFINKLPWTLVVFV